MADSKLTTEYRCGYCYLEFNSMTDPRELPCHHVFCITCLQGDCTDNNNICCRSCQRVYNMKTFDHLPTASLDTQVVVDTLSSLICDCHNCDGQNAVSYCLDCRVKMCDTHRQNHKALLGDKHEVIFISTYEMSAGTYKRVTCKQHGGEPVLEVCERCNQPACLRCDRNGKTCAEDAQHVFSSLNKLKEEITAHFNRLLQSASNKLTEIYKLDKHIWKLLDDEEFECKKRIEMIERICDEQQIEVMGEESEKLKEQIYEYQKTLTDQVELYNTELMDNKDKLEESRTKVHKWLRESPVTEKLQQKQQMTDELRKNTDIELDCELTRTPLVVRTGRCPSLYITLANTPTSITFKSEQPTNLTCYSASYKEDGDLLLGCDDGVRLLRQDNIQMSKYDTTDESVTSVAEHRRNLFVLHEARTTWTVEMCLPDIKQREKLFSFHFPGNSASFVAVSDLYVIAVNPEENTLVLYEFLTTQTTVLHPEKRPWSVCFLPDGDLVVTSRSAIKCLTRYKIKNKKLTKVWTCEGLKDIQTVCTDSDGFIYACATNKRRTLYIISPDGVKLQEIKNDKLPDEAGQISIQGRDELAVPSWGGKSVCLFKINH